MTRPLIDGVDARFAHDPRARTSAECRACAVNSSYDHVAVAMARLPGFDAQVRAGVRLVAAGATHLYGVTLHPDAQRRAALWLDEHDD